MKLEEAIDTLKNEICDYVIPNYCNDCENKSECLDDCNFILSIYTVLQELEHLQKESEELRKRFRRYGDVDSVRLAQIKEIEESVPKYYIDKAQIQDLLKEE